MRYSNYELPTNTSGYKGVYLHKPLKKWKAMITHNGKLLYLGLFSAPLEAAEAYDKKAVELFGSFALLNQEISSS